MCVSTETFVVPVSSVGRIAPGTANRLKQNFSSGSATSSDGRHTHTTQLAATGWGVHTQPHTTARLGYVSLAAQGSFAHTTARLRATCIRLHSSACVSRKGCSWAATNTNTRGSTGTVKHVAVPTHTPTPTNTTPHQYCIQVPGSKSGPPNHRPPTHSTTHMPLCLNTHHIPTEGRAHWNTPATHTHTHHTHTHTPVTHTQQHHTGQPLSTRPGCIVRMHMRHVSGQMMLIKAGALAGHSTIRPAQPARCVVATQKQAAACTNHARLAPHTRMLHNMILLLFWCPRHTCATPHPSALAASQTALTPAGSFVGSVSVVVSGASGVRSRLCASPLSALSTCAASSMSFLCSASSILYTGDR